MANVPLNHEIQIGLAIRQLRMERQMTLTELGERTNLSAGHLSQIERGIADPSFSALRGIAAAFDIPLTKLLLAGNGADRTQEEFIRRKEDRTYGKYPGTKIKFQLIEVPKSTVQFLWITAPPGAGIEPHKRNAPGEECALVLSGKMQVCLDDAEFILQAGDAVFIQAYTVMHGWKNIGDEELVAIWVTSPRI